MSSGTLEVPDALLSYVTVGKGPLLLLIPGANSDSSIWGAMSNILAMSFTVCSYSRRGFKDSYLRAPQDYTGDIRLSRDADDAADLIMHLSPVRPAYVLGSSTGAIVALRLLQRHEDAVKSVICHEPPLVSILKPQDAQHMGDGFADVAALYRTHGLPVATEALVRRMHRPADADVARQMLNLPVSAGDTAFWLEYELRQYTAVELNFDRLREHGYKTTLLHGRDTSGSFLHACTEAVAARCNAQMRVCPGGPLAYATKPNEFAEAVIKILLPTPGFMWPMFVT